MLPSFFHSISCSHGKGKLVKKKLGPSFGTSVTKNCLPFTHNLLYTQKQGRLGGSPPPP